MPFSSLLRRWTWFIVLTLTAFACAAPFLPDPTPFPPTPTPEIGKGLVAFLGQDGNVYIYNPNSEQSFAITTDAQPVLGSGENIILYRYPAWSHDGRFLAFVSVRAGTGDDGTALLVSEPGSTAPADLQEIFFSRSETPFYLYWAPDSASLTFLGSSQNSPSLLMRRAFLDGSVALILDSGQPYYWHWSPDASQILVHEGGSQRDNPAARLSLLEPDTGESSRLELAPYRFQAPTWAPDGESFLAVVGKDGNEGELARFSGEGKLLQSLLDVEGQADFSLSPDGTLIAVHPRTTLGGVLGPLQMLDAETGESIWNSNDDNVVAYFWSPDGKRLAFFHLDTGESLDALVSINTQQGRAVVVLSVLQLESNQVRRLAGFEPTLDFLEIVPFIDQYHHSLTIWAPDSSQLVFTGVDERGEDAVWLVSADGGQPPQRVFEGSLAIWSWR